MSSHANRGRSSRARAGTELPDAEVHNGSSSRTSQRPSPYSHPAHPDPRLQDPFTSPSTRPRHLQALSGSSYQPAYVLAPPPPFYPRGNSTGSRRQASPTPHRRSLHQSPSITYNSSSQRASTRSSHRSEHQSPHRASTRSRHRSEYQSPPRTPPGTPPRTPQSSPQRYSLKTSSDYSSSPQRYPSEEDSSVQRYSSEKVSSEDYSDYSSYHSRSPNPYLRSSEAYHRSPTPQYRSSHQPSHRPSHQQGATAHRQPLHRSSQQPSRQPSHQQKSSAHPHSARRSSARSRHHKKSPEFRTPIGKMKRFLKKMSRRSPSPPRRRSSTSRRNSSGPRRESRRSSSAQSDAHPPAAHDVRNVADQPAPVQPPVQFPMPATPFPAIINNPLRYAGYRQTSTGEVHPLYVPITPEQARPEASNGQPAETRAAAAPAAEGQSSRRRSSGEERKAGKAKAIHFCQQCGNARSTHYHKENPVRPGQTPKPSICTSCRKKLLARSGELKHFCAGCGTARSKQYHLDHPVAPGETPRPSYCLECRRRFKKLAEAGDDWEDDDDDDEDEDGPSPPSHQRPTASPAEPVAGPSEGNAEGPGAEPQNSGSNMGGDVPTNAASSGQQTPGVSAGSHPHDGGDNHTFVVLVQAPCHHGGGGAGRAVEARPACEHCAAPAPPRRQVTFSQPEVTGHYEAHADDEYDRSAVAENYEREGEEEEEGAPTFGHTPVPRRSSFEGRPRRSQAGPAGTPPVRASSSRGGGVFVSSDGLFSSPDEEESPPPTYEPPKVLTPDEIRALWGQGPQPQPPRHYSANFGNGGQSATNERSSSAGDRYQGSREPGRENRAPDHYSSGSNSRSDRQSDRGHERLDGRPRFDSRGSGNPSSSQRSSHENFNPRAEEARRPAFAWSPSERERLWHDNPEHLRKMRESTERLMRAARESDQRRSSAPPPSAGPSMPRPPPPTASTTDSPPRRPDFSQGYMPHRPSSSRGPERATPHFIPTPSPPTFDHGPPLNEIPIGQRRCGPECNRFCLHRDDYVEREIVELPESETESQGSNGKGKGKSKHTGKQRSRDSNRSGQSSSRSNPIFGPNMPVFTPPSNVAGPASPARSTGSAYFSASSEISPF